MTKAERLAAKIARDKASLEQQRLALVQHEAALRDETRKATDRRRYQVGALADAAGLLAWSNDEIAALFARVVTLRAQSADLLATLLAEPVTSSESARKWRGRVCDSCQRYALIWSAAR